MIAPLNSTTNDHIAWGPWGTSASPANARCRVSLRKELRNTGSLVAEKLQSRVERLLSILSSEARRVITHIFAHQVRFRSIGTFRRFFRNVCVDFFVVIFIVLRDILRDFLAHLFFFLLLLILLQLPLLVTHIFKVGRCCYVEMPDRIATYVLDSLRTNEKRH